MKVDKILFIFAILKYKTSLMVLGSGGSDEISGGADEQDERHGSLKPS